MIKRVTVFIAGLALTAWLVPAFAQYSPEGAQAAQAVQEGAPAPRKLAVPYDHNEHNKKAKLKNCVVCHHGLKNGRRVTTGKGLDRRCSECHLERPMTHTDPPSLMSISHASCQGCHKKMNKGPVKCSQCHPQQQ